LWSTCMKPAGAYVIIRGRKGRGALPTRWRTSFGCWKILSIRVTAPPALGNSARIGYPATPLGLTDPAQPRHPPGPGWTACPRWEVRPVPVARRSVPAVAGGEQVRRLDYPVVGCASVWTVRLVYITIRVEVRSSVEASFATLRWGIAAVPAHASAVPGADLRHGKCGTGCRQG
jgi:hypothetical protein